MKTKISELFKKTVLLAPQTTGTGTEAYVQPTAGVKNITILSTALMGNAADLTLSLKYADDASGTNATAFPVNVPIYVNGARGTDAKEYAITASSGNFIVEFVVDPMDIPDGKYVGISYANSNAANLLSSLTIEETGTSL